MKTSTFNILRTLAFPAVLISAIGLTEIVHAGSSPEPVWRLVRPTNTGILGDYVQTIFLDEQDLPWIGAYTPFWEEGGMSHFDGHSWLPVSNVDYPVIASPRFNDIVKGAGGIMWIATDFGLLKYNPAVGPSSLVRYDQYNTPMPASQIVDIDLAPDGAIWLAIHDVDSVPSGGLARFDPATGAWQSWTSFTGLPWGAEWPHWDWVDHVAVVQDPGGSFTVWFASNEVGVGTYRDGVMQWFGVPSLIPFGSPLTPTGIPSNRPVDNLNNLWLKTNLGLARRAPDGTYMVVGYPAGLTSEVSVVFALRNGRAALGTYYSDIFRWNGGWSYLGNWGGTHTYAFAEDSRGNIWAGGIGGSAKYVNGFWQRYRLTNTGMLGFWISTIAFDNVGNVYMDANAGPGVGGFDVLHPDGTWTNANDFTYGLGLPWGLPTDDVRDMVVRNNGHLAIALNGPQGAVDFNGASYAYLLPQGEDIVKIAEDGLGRIWAAQYEGGIFRVTGTQHDLYLPGSSQLPYGEISEIIPEPGNPGFVWIIAPGGLAHTDGTTWQVYPRELLGMTEWTTGYFISDGDRAPDGTFWLGSGRGLFHFNPQTLQYTQYTPADSSLVSDVVQRVKAAPDGSVWASTMDDTWPYPGGLSHFDGTTWTNYSPGSSPMPHNQVWALNSRPTADGGYEVWVGTASEAIAVIKMPAPFVPADLNHDGHVNSLDLGIVLSSWSIPSTAPGCRGAKSCPADLNGDGFVNSLDLGILLASWTL